MSRCRWRHTPEFAFEKRIDKVRKAADSLGGIQEAADLLNLRSPEAYLGYGRADGFVSPGGARQDITSRYDLLTRLHLNQWGLAGNWTISAEQVRLNRSGCSIVHRFHVRDLHLVLGLPSDGKPVRFRIKIDDFTPGSTHGPDVDPEGLGTVTSERLRK